MVWGVILAQIQDPALSLLNFTRFLCTHLSSLLGGSTAFWCISHSSKSHNISNLFNGTPSFHPGHWWTILETTAPSTTPWGPLLATGLQLDSALLFTTLRARPISQFSIHFTVLSSNQHFLSLPMRIWRETVPKALLEPSICWSCLMHSGSCAIIEDYQDGQAQFLLGESMLTIPDNLLLLHTLKGDLWNDLRYHFSRNKGGGNWPVLSCVLFHALLKNSSDIGFLWNPHSYCPWHTLDLIPNGPYPSLPHPCTFQQHSRVTPKCSVPFSKRHTLPSSVWVLHLL